MQRLTGMIRHSLELRGLQMLDIGKGLIMTLESELDHLMSDCGEDGKHILDYLECKIQIRKQKHTRKEELINER